MTNIEVAADTTLADFLDVASGLLDRVPNDIATLLLWAGLLYIEDTEPRLLSWAPGLLHSSIDHVDEVLDSLMHEVGENPIRVS